MTWQQVESSNLRQVAYDADSCIMLIQFTNGSMYAYPRVPKILYEDLLASESKGKFFFEFIKFSFEYMKVLP